MSTPEPGSRPTFGHEFDDIAGKHRWPDNREKKIALCLSGGGFRATLFHLGALRRLHELGILAQVDTIASVSGGSIMSACLANRIVKEGYEKVIAQEWNNDVSEQIHLLTSRNLRTGPIAKRLIPYNWGWPPAAVEAFAARLEKELTSLQLHELPDRPWFIFCATDMEHGEYWTAERNCIGSPKAGYRQPDSKWPLAYAVAASACFPPVFAPLVVEEPTFPKTGDGNHRECDGDKPAGDGTHRFLHLSDGGNLDNTGMEAVWRSHTTVLVADGGGTFDPAWKSSFFWKLQRYSGILDERSRELSRRWFFEGLQEGHVEGAYWGLDHPRWVSSKEGYSDKQADELISEIRTDLDAFSEDECKILENHGYFKADAAVRASCNGLITHDVEPTAPWPNRLPAKCDVGSALRNSHKRKAFPFGGRW